MICFLLISNKLIPYCYFLLIWSADTIMVWVFFLLLLLICYVTSCSNNTALERLPVTWCPKHNSPFSSLVLSFYPFYSSLDFCLWDLRAVSAVKSVYCCHRGSKFSSQNQERAAHSGLKVQCRRIQRHALFSPQQAPKIMCAYSPTHTNTCES